MPVLLLLLGLAVFAYFFWRSRTTSLTRDCRWREHRSEGLWRCSACGAEQKGLDEPKACLRQ